MDKKDQALIFSGKGNLVKPLQGTALVNILPQKKGDPYLIVEGEKEEVETLIEAMVDYIQQRKRNHQLIRAAPEPKPKPTPSADGRLKAKKENEFNFEVDKEYSGIVIAKGGAHATNYAKEHKVIMKLNKDDLQSSVLVTLIGTPDNVLKVHKDIMKRLEAAKAYNARKRTGEATG